MIKFSKDKILLLHRLVSEQTGGDIGVRDESLIESAISSAFQTFDGEELFKTIEEKAAKLGYALISNHAFVDGNKRIGMFVMITFMEVNGIKIFSTDSEVAELGLSVAAGQKCYEDVLNWIKTTKLNKLFFIKFQTHAQIPRSEKTLRDLFSE